jgi:hypothetical protein
MKISIRTKRAVNTAPMEATQAFFIVSSILDPKIRT